MKPAGAVQDKMMHKYVNLFSGTPCKGYPKKVG